MVNMLVLRLDDENIDAVKVAEFLTRTTLHFISIYFYDNRTHASSCGKF